MRCSKPARESVQLSCSFADQLACGCAALAYRLDTGPNASARLLDELLNTFPDHLVSLFVVAQRAGRLPQFIDRAARRCAARPTKAGRYAFRNQLASRICAGTLPHSTP